MGFNVFKGILMDLKEFKEILNGFEWIFRDLKELEGIYMDLKGYKWI